MIKKTWAQWKANLVKEIDDNQEYRIPTSRFIQEYCEIFGYFTVSLFQALSEFGVQNDINFEIIGESGEAQSMIVFTKRDGIQ